MIEQAIRFVSTSLNGGEDKQVGTAWLTDDATLDYSSPAVEHTMASMVRRVGAAKAFDFFRRGGANSTYIRSEPLDLAQAQRGR